MEINEIENRKKSIEEIKKINETKKLILWKDQLKKILVTYTKKRRPN